MCFVFFLDLSKKSNSASLRNLKLLQDNEDVDATRKMELIGLSPYWFDIAAGSGIRNTVSMQSMFLLTGPNGGGKSSLLRSICAAALLGICGLMVPAESALVPHFDSIMLHMKSYDSPADGKSSFQVIVLELELWHLSVQCLTFFPLSLFMMPYK